MKSAAKPTSEELSLSQRVQAQADVLFFSIGDGAIAIDQQGNISRINKAALDMLGYQKKDVLHRSFLKTIEVVDPDGKPVDPLERPITQALITGETVIAKTHYRKKDGQLITVSVTVSPVILNGEPVGAVEVFRDITQEEEVDRMKSEFISIASHQLRTPLTAIKTYSHLLQNGYVGKLTSEQGKLIEIVLASTDHMNNLIDILLDISKIEAGKLHVEPEAVPTKSLVADVVAEFESEASKKGVELNVRLSKMPDQLFIDPVLAKEIYSNLLSNAIKYTEAGGKISVVLQRKRRVIILSVKDTGCGIPASQKDRIFGKFFRAENVLALESNGSGLGLYMVKKIAQAMDGDVWFDSEENVGSTFYFSIPYDETVAKLNA